MSLKHVLPTVDPAMKNDKKNDMKNDLSCLHNVSGWNFLSFKFGSPSRKVIL